MKPAPFEYLAPDSLAEALAILAEQGDEAKVLAGGQSLVPAMNFRLVEPSVIVDINRLSELEYINAGSNGEIHIGALTRHRQLELNPQIASLVPLLHETMPEIAHLQIRNRGTIGGSLVHADPAAELPVIMVALKSRFRLVNSKAERWVSAVDFFQGLFTTALEPEELLVEVTIPRIPANTGTCFMEFARRKGDYALLGVATVLNVDDNGVCRDARIVYLNAGDGPLVATDAGAMLNGAALNDELFIEVARFASENEIQPTGNIHATVPYLRHLARVLTTRALSKAAKRAVT